MNMAFSPGAMRPALGLLLALALAIDATPGRAAGVTPLTICYGSEAAALVPLAQFQGFYADEGLKVETKGFPSGFQALAAMLAGDCALSTAAVPPVVFQALQRSDFRILAAISSSGEFERILALRDRGILVPEDLRGRRIAVARATSAHYFLDMFLAAHGLLPGDVTQVYLQAQAIGPALLAGEVDAVAYWEPHIRHLAKQLGERAQVFGFPGLVVSPFLLLGRQDLVEQGSGAVQGVLRALLRAERSMAQAPEEAARLLAPVYGELPADFNLVCSLHEFAVRLDQPLPFLLENAARWQLGLLPAPARPPLPDVMKLIDLNDLRAVRPAVVSILD
ncbi:ABC transporter substrate-binding protein [uncultured Thiodictyon sp.]|uniref:ABC transporter substrate-binding protein n=1 Tax=uncultured Thiodictyon sp. TaxID=1846217 RepID=UPI0025EABD0D|nr:NrtA/SsuA/CpmA family ABC transporter substrate-binding protein [uncultured Thiodictyon sp.]